VSLFLIRVPLGTREIGGALESVSVHFAVSEVLIIARCAKEGIFCLARKQSCEKRLLASTCLFVCPHGTTRLTLDGFS
jgi:hypothetical protein